MLGSPFLASNVLFLDSQRPVIGIFSAETRSTWRAARLLLLVVGAVTTGVVTPPQTIH
jgi:hypothetical protein